MAELAPLLVGPESTVREVMACIDKSGKGVAFVVDAKRRLIATVTDGDIRRAILAGVDLDSRVETLQEHKLPEPYPTPFSAPVDTSKADLLKTMNQYTLRHIPLVDGAGKVVDVALLSELVKECEPSLTAVVMAGGFGTRLLPLTETLPKPMLRVGERPLLELIIEQLREAGIERVNLTTHYKKELIAEHFGDGRDFGVDIRYIEEDQPLGTAGALGLLDKDNEPLLVVNGDVITQVDFKAMLDFHREHDADMTVGVRQYKLSVPYGVVESDGVDVAGVAEEPSVRQFINAGVYLLNPGFHRFIPDGQAYDMTDLINGLVAEGRRVVSFPIHEYWIDIGRIEDYERAQSETEFISTSSEPGAPAPAGVIPLCVPELSGNEWKYAKQCLDTNWISSAGPFVDRLEREVADFVGARYAVAAGSGTAALHVALLVAGVEPDDEVLTSTLSFIAPANAIRYVGAWPVFMDADSGYWQMDTDKLADFLRKECRADGGVLRNKATGRRIKAILPVHLLGHPCDMDPIFELAGKYGITVVEDAAESLGAEYRERKVGHLGDISCLSFNANKVITTGGGGMIVTDNEEWARRARHLTTQAKADPVEYVHDEIGYNYRLTNVQAAIGCAQMERLDSHIAAKRCIAARYAEGLADVPGITLMREASWASSAHWMSTILVNEKEYGMDSRALLRWLVGGQIHARPLWQPLHLSTVHAQSQAYRIEVAERLYGDALSLPSSVGLGDAQLEAVVAAVRSGCK